MKIALPTLHQQEQTVRLCCLRPHGRHLCGCEPGIEPNIGPDDGLDPLVTRGLVKLHRTKKVAQIGERQGWLLILCGSSHAIV